MNPHSQLFDKVLGCLAGGVIGDAMGTPTEKLTYQQIQERFGWVTTFSGDGTDDSLLKHILCETLERTEGHATADLWAEDWLRNKAVFIDSKQFFVPVLATFWKRRGANVAPREAGLGKLSLAQRSADALGWMRCTLRASQEAGLLNAARRRSARAQRWPSNRPTP